MYCLYFYFENLCTYTLTKQENKTLGDTHDTATSPCAFLCHIQTAEVNTEHLIVALHRHYIGFKKGAAPVFFCRQLFACYFIVSSAGEGEQLLLITDVEAK